MGIADIRRQNLVRVLNLLHREGLTTPEEQARFLGNIVPPSKLRLMVETESVIPEIFARAVEHRLRFARGWMDQENVPGRARQPLEEDRAPDSSD
ncbi:hypothetical protein SAMN02800692_1493 [Luteibacter sp. UNC138MFCol5.1]|nr:hypothetical protein SAMN02800692_1493 [Luteibacter sp. UNC138MFCol5.1]